MGLETVELVMAIEEEFGITVPDDVAPALARLGDLHSFVIQALQDRGEPAEPAAAWGRLKAVIRRDFAIEDSRLVPGAHLVHDLGLD